MSKVRDGFKSLHFFKMLTFLFVLLTVALVDAKVPSYITVCGRRNPKLDECVIKSVQEILPKLRYGLPEIDVPSLEPMLIDELYLADLPDFRAKAIDVKLGGLSNFRVNDLHTDLENQVINMNVFFANITMDSEYQVKAKILVPIQEKGLITSVAKDTTAQVQMKFKKINKRGKIYLFFSSVKTKITIDDYVASFTIDSPNNEKKALSDAINAVLQSDRKEIISSMLPNIEKAISKYVIELSNKVSKNWTYDELFPDRE